MANPQTENGYTRISNEILEQLIFNKFSGQELQAILFVIRKTYGYNKKEDVISLSQFAKALKINKIRACQVIQKLVDRNILTVTENINGISRKMKLNKDYEQWITVNENINRYTKHKPPVNENIKPTVNEKRNRPLMKTLTTKDNITKDSFKENSDSEKIESPQPQKIPRKHTFKPADDDEWLKQLSQNPAYSGIDIQDQLYKCVEWFKCKNLQVSRQRFLNWLNRTDKKITKKFSAEMRHAGAINWHLNKQGDKTP